MCLPVILSRCSSFESTERQEWPRNALKFTDILLTSLKKVSDSPDGPMAPLFDSIQDLKEMVVLYENYKIPITFSKFTQVRVLSHFQTVFYLNLNCTSGEQVGYNHSPVELAADSCRRWSVFGCVSVAIYASTSHGH